MLNAAPSARFRPFQEIPECEILGPALQTSTHLWQVLSEPPTTCNDLSAPRQAFCLGSAGQPVAYFRDGPLRFSLCEWMSCPEMSEIDAR